MKLIAGLGNPGAKYRDTRHNVGFEVVDVLARRHGAEFESAPGEAVLARIRSLADGVLLVKPLTSMNLSGHALAELIRYYRVALPDVLVIVDEVQLPLGRLRARARGSPGGHNGLKSVAGQLGSDEYARLRIGVGRGDDRRDLADHVLARFEPDERETIRTAIQRAADAAEVFATDGIEKVMNTFNRAEDLGTTE
ncbi:MAG TPA: aminoacyl-tRNA hydrolase [Vicinamibacterales bacterium]